MLAHFLKKSAQTSSTTSEHEAAAAATTAVAAASWVDSLLPDRPLPSSAALSTADTATGTAAKRGEEKVLTPHRLLLESDQPAERLLLLAILVSAVSMR
jgi:hypothetical protein